MTNLSAYVRGNIEFDETNYSQALNFYNEVTIDIPSPDYSTEEELLVYESAMAMAVLALNRQNNMNSYNTAMTKPQVYFSTVRIDSVELQYGGDWRAYLLYNQADAVYYSSYNPRGEVRNIKRHQEAFDKYQFVLDNYPGAYVSTLAKVAMAWYKLENQRYPEAIADFENTFDNTLKTDARVLAAYGNALANFYSGNYTTAGSWFLSEQDYQAMGVATRREEATDRLRYNEIADSLIARNLYWRGVCYERLNAYGDALEIYTRIVDDYRTRPKAGEAARKTIEILLMAGEVDRGAAKVEEVKSLMTQHRRVYRDAYGYGLAAMFDYYANVIGDETTAEDYAKRLTSELGTSEPIEELYYRQAMRDTSVGLIGDLRDKIQKIRVLNPRSQFLPEPMYNLSYLLFTNEEYDEAKEVLVELKNWPDANATRDMMPDISYQLSRVYFEMDGYADAVTELEAWTRYYETGDNARTDLAPYIYWWLGWSYYQQGEQEGLSPQVRAGFYRKALSNFENLQNAYGDSEFYQGVTTEVDQLIAQCKRKIG
jgi:tetratricopeptide (TPR) repeat protein